MSVTTGKGRKREISVKYQEGMKTPRSCVEGIVESSSVTGTAGSPTAGNKGGGGTLSSLVSSGRTRGGKSQMLLLRINFYHNLD